MSHPLRVRGLKQMQIRLVKTLQVVASFTGAWIETIYGKYISSNSMVASFTGAWIETWNINNLKKKALVASFTGAWIETGLCI